jgi:hypothetical protein
LDEAASQLAEVLKARANWADPYDNLGLVLLKKVTIRAPRTSSGVRSN